MCVICVYYVSTCAYVGQICIIMHFQYYKCINKHIIWYRASALGINNG